MPIYLRSKCARTVIYSQNHQASKKISTVVHFLAPPTKSLCSKPRHRVEGHHVSHSVVRWYGFKPLAEWCLARPTRPWNNCYSPPIVTAIFASVAIEGVESNIVLFSTNFCVPQHHQLTFFSWFHLGCDYLKICKPSLGEKYKKLWKLSVAHLTNMHIWKSQYIYFFLRKKT